jgi:hypothetical protein
MPFARAAFIASSADERRRFGQRAEDAAGVEPARARGGRRISVPVDVAGLELRNRGVPAIGAAERRADTEARAR